MTTSERYPDFKPICWRYGYGEKAIYADSGVYFIKKEGVDEIKIGRSITVDKRRSTFKTANGGSGDLKVICVCRTINPPALEKAFHNVFALRRVFNPKRTEWFNITIEDVKTLLSSDQVKKSLQDLSWDFSFKRFVTKETELKSVFIETLKRKDYSYFLSILLENLESRPEKESMNNLETYFAHLLSSLGLNRTNMYRDEINLLITLFPLFKCIPFPIFMGALLEVFGGFFGFITYTKGNDEILSVFRAESPEDAKKNPLYSVFLIPDNNKIPSSNLVYSR